MSECYSFVVNGVPCSTEEEKPLLRYLRDELRLTSVKDAVSYTHLTLPTTSRV